MGLRQRTHFVRCGRRHFSSQIENEFRFGLRVKVVLLCSTKTRIKTPRWRFLSARTRLSCSTKIRIKTPRHHTVLQPQILSCSTKTRIKTILFLINRNLSAAAISIKTRIKTFKFPKVDTTIRAAISIKTRIKTTYFLYHLNYSGLLCSIKTRISSKWACDKELTSFVVVAAISPLKSKMNFDLVTSKGSKMSSIKTRIKTGLLLSAIFQYQLLCSTKTRIKTHT